jgi:hypothetical protein
MEKLLLYLIHKIKTINGQRDTAKVFLQHLNDKDEEEYK